MSASAATKIAFVDTAIADSQKLIASLDNDVEVVLVNGGDGLDEMAEVLKNRSGLDAIMVFSHGEEGEVVIGDATLSSTSLDRYASDLAAIGGSLSETGDLLLYGCSVGAGTDGRALVDELALRTGADVAASDDPTGAAALGGDWDLEVRSGDVAAAPLDTAALRDVSGLLAITSEETLTFSSGANGRDVGIVDGIAFYDFAYVAGSITSFSSPASFSATDGNFDLISIKAALTGSGSYYLAFKGYDESNNLITGASYTKTGLTSSFTTITFGSAFDNVHTIKVITDGDPSYFYLDDLTVGAAVSPNTAPVIDNLGGDTLTYLEGSGAVILDQGTEATVTDSDSANFDTGTLTVSIVSGRAEDVLAIRNQGMVAGQIGISSGTVSYGGTAIGTFTGGSGTDNLVVTLNSNCTVAAAQALIENITYTNTNTTTPDTTGRTVNFTLTDGDGGTSTTQHVTVAVVDVNDPPTLSATSSNPTYVPGGAGAALFSATAISTVESLQSITSVTLTVGGLADGASEILRVDGVDVALTNGTSGNTATAFAYAVGVSGGTATVTLTKIGADITTWQNLINGLQYRNDSSNPTTTGRTVTLTQVTDNGGRDYSGVDSTSLTVASAVTFAQPTITSATYDVSTGTLVVTGTNFQANGSGADIDVSKLAVTGDGGTTYTLTSPSVEITNATSFTVMLTPTDQAALRSLLNANGATSTGGTTYNLAAADNWDTVVTAGDTADATNALTISSVPAPTIASATYDVSTGQLVVTGTDFLSRSGSANDIDVSKLTITGEGAPPIP